MESPGFLFDLFANAALGLSHALSIENLLYCALGVTLGTFLGALPGILAMGLHSVGMIGKLYADAIEELRAHDLDEFVEALLT